MIQQVIHDTAEAAAYRVIELVHAELDKEGQQKLFNDIYGILSESLGISVDWYRSLLTKVSSN